MQKVASVSLLTLCLLLVCGGICLAQSPDQLKFVSGPPGGTWFSLGGTISDVLTKAVIPTTSSTGGGVSNVVNIHQGKADLGLSAAVLGMSAQRGEEPFKSPLPNTYCLANLYKQYFYFVVRADYAQKNGVSTMADVFQKKLPIRLATLTPGTVSEFVVRQAFAIAGATYDDIKARGGKVEYASYDDGASLLADNHIDAFVFTVSNPASIILQIETQLDIRILPTDQEILEKMNAAWGTATHTIKAGTYKCLTEDIAVIGDYTNLLVRGDLPEELVYNMTKALFEQQETLAQFINALEEFNPKDGSSDTVFPIHPGAAKYYQEVGALP